MSENPNWFKSIYFRARGEILPELILEDGSRVNRRELKKFENLQKLLRESILTNEDRPMILYNGTHRLENLDKILITRNHLKVLQNNQVAVYMNEPLTHYIPQGRGILEPHILKIDNRPDELPRIRCFELDSLQDWAVKHNITDICVYCTDYKCHRFYQKIYPNLKLLSLDLYVEWICNRISMFEKRNPRVPRTPDLYPMQITKKFWSGAWRYESYRHFITAYLAGKDLIKDSNVGFYYKMSNTELKDNLWFDWDIFHYRNPQIGNSVLIGNDELQKIVPLSISVVNPKAVNKNIGDPGIGVGDSNIRTTHNPITSYKETFCAIIHESRFTQPWPNVSEKTMNAITSHRPFVMCAAPGTLTMLKDMGFKTFDKYWPEDYDDIISNQARLVRICETIDYISKFSINEMREMYEDMADILYHNDNQIGNLRQYYNNINDEIMRSFDDKAK